MMVQFLADAQLDTQGYAANLKNLIFFGVVVLAVIAAIIWWLRR
ncbi:MAG: hypothetical protein ABR964_06745 [Tepidisphaeraceae bacterium]|jgi:heme/copper-type cytochrome/quinol oxidase subunit 4